MSTHKHIDKICCVAMAVALALSLLFMNGSSLGIQAASTVMGYEDKLFDTSKVHTLDILMEDWEGFLDNCRSEEYYECNVIIDGEAFKNVAIRGKGNTSLTQVESYGNDRYSYKIEFDHYDKALTYHGLDKLCLNNIIQDNTYMKDYLTYQMMGDMGVAAPLCSYVYITVNGEDWGLYLAVEAVEESFLQRNYGKDYGELYKPDSMKMGGGRGNGKEFDMDKFLDEEDESFIPGQEEHTDRNEAPDMAQPPDMVQWPGMEQSTDREQPSAPMQQPDMKERPDMSNFGGNGQRPGRGPTSTEDNFPGGEMSDMGEFPREEMPDMGRFPEGQKTDMGDIPGGMKGSSQDVLLQYIDDEISSYQNIFDSAKTDVSTTDKERLIASLKRLSNREDLKNTLDMETLIRYFVVHNFVLNFDSYTGSMIHNYYLYEEDGRMQMIPWDYNLAFGGFQSMSDATTYVNYPMDSPVSGGNMADRPMIAWIFESEEYTDIYHQIFDEFISEYFESGYFSDMMDEVSTMIAPYLEKDPTKFCTTEEFEIGIDTLKEFCLLRAESIRGQLNGNIGSTTESQSSDTLIQADHLNISDMGNMGMRFGEKGDRQPGRQ